MNKIYCMRKIIIVICLYLIVCVLIPYPITLIMKGSGRTKVVEDDEVGNKLSDMNDYIFKTMAPYYEEGDGGEFLKALAIVVRTYYENNEGEDFFSPESWTYSQMKENWGEYYPAYYEAILTAIEETDGIVMTMESGEVKPYFCRVSAGYTRILPGSCLAMVGCNDDLNSPDYMTVVTLSGEKVLEKIKKFHDDIRLQGDILDSFQIVSRDEAGYVTELMIGNVIMSGDDAAKIFGIPSGNFIITVSGDSLVFTVKGVGSGYGMSLYSARKKAVAGAGYRELLFYFYKNINIDSE